MQGNLRKKGWSFLVAGRAKVSLYLPPWGMGVFGLQAGQRCLSTYHRGGWEFFGCGRGEGVSLPTAAEGLSFLVAGGARVSLYLPPQEQGAENRPPRRRDGRWWAIAGV